MLEPKKIIKKWLPYSDFLKIEKATIEVFSKRENQVIEVDRETLLKQEAVAVLVFNIETQKFIFTRQFRYPVMEKHGGTLLEIPAGAVEHGEDVLESGKREVFEEVGYEVSNFEFISATYVSPGCSTEITQLYYAEVTNQDCISAGGGLKEETEEIDVVELSIQEVLILLEKHQIRDAKTFMALLWFQNSKMEYLESIIE